MPRESCIQHNKRSPFVMVRLDYMDLFDGDACSAALLGYFEYLTNGELDRQEACEEEFEPWVSASMNQITKGMLGLYGSRAIQDRIPVLIERGYLSCSQVHTGAVKRYLLQIDLINSELQSIGKFAGVRNRTSAKAPVVLPVLEPDIRVKVPDRSIETEEPLNPLPVVLEKEPATEPPGTIAGQDIRALDMEPCDEDGTVSAEPVRQTRSQWGSRRLGGGFGQRKERRLGAGAAVREALSGTTPTAEAPAYPRSRAFTKPVVQDPPVRSGASDDLVARWNVAVPMAQVATRPSIDIPTDAEFISNFEAICTKALAIHAGPKGGECGWLTLRWLVKANNWSRLLAGEYDWMSRSGQTKKTGAAANADLVKGVIARLRAESAAKEKAEEQNASE